MANLKDRKDAMLYIAKEHQGTKDVLVKEIGEELYEQFCRMGFIKKGITSQDKILRSTWQITESGRRQSFFYRDPNQEEKKLGQIYNSLGI